MDELLMDLEDFVGHEDLAAALAIVTGGQVPVGQAVERVREWLTTVAQDLTDQTKRIEQLLRECPPASLLELSRIHLPRRGSYLFSLPGAAARLAEMYLCRNVASFVDRLEDAVYKNMLIRMVFSLFRMGADPLGRRETPI